MFSLDALPQNPSISALFTIADTIDVTNLNRQFLFRQKDIGQSKAVVAAEFINRRCPWMNVVPYNGKIQDKDADFYRQFKVVISGLDNIEARRWLNGMMSTLVEFDEETRRPDGEISLLFATTGLLSISFLAGNPADP
jgi:tRNA A37 threonylcarbamoyladenosine dehydratase